MRKVFKYSNYNINILLSGLLNISKQEEYISILLSNTNHKEKIPKDYIQYDLIAGVGQLSFLVSNNDSFDNLYKFSNNKKDWLFGYISYDIKNEIENLSSKNVDGFNTNNLFFFVPKYVIIFKNNELKVLTYNNREKTNQFVESLNIPCTINKTKNVKLRAREDKISYLKKINKIKEHIKKGDIYEMNYCQEFYSESANFSPQSMFLEINKSMQTPFTCFLRVQSKHVLSFSPERYLRKKGNHILSQPIKGTISRGNSYKKDLSNIKFLKKNQKDISENIMITDLVRNDLSITSLKGAVQVEELCEVYTFEKVHQMITTISSKISSNEKFTDVLKSTFPMGSMTGAPKLKSMELIDLYEEFRRGIFSGSIGYVSPNCDFDFSVVIRTILYNLNTRYLSIGVGGAITMKSDPCDEYNECMTKVMPILKILENK